MEGQILTRNECSEWHQDERELPSEINGLIGHMNVLISDFKGLSRAAMD